MSANDDSEQKEATVEASSPKKPYSPPKLRHLGSVRELTLGRSAGGSEVGGKVKGS